jgi:hypothetical protein
LIEDTEGNVFGGFTPLGSDWRTYDQGVDGGHCFKADPSLKSFLFTLKNAHNFPARKFALKAARKNEAIHCESSCGPHFRDICVSANCNANTASYTCLIGGSYANDTGLAANTFVTGSGYFEVKEIEVFETTD